MIRRRLLILVPLLLAIALTTTNAQRITVSSRTLEFPCTTIGERSNLTITVSNTGSTALSNIRFELAPNSQFIPPQGQFQIPPGRERTFTITFAPNPPIQIGTRSETMTIRAATDRVNITLIGRAAPPPAVFVNSFSLDFQTVATTDTAEQCLILENPSCVDIAITQVALIDPDFKLPAPPQLPYILKGGEQLRICVELLPGTLGPVEGRMIVRAEVAGDPSRNATLNVELTGRRTLPPGLVVVPPRGLDFGDVPINLISRELQVGITSEASEVLTIDRWNLTGNDSGEFIVYPPQLPAQLRPNSDDTLWFPVRFAPSIAGLKSAELQIGSADGNMRTAVLRGNGIRSGLAANPLNLNLGEQLVGGSLTLSDTILLRNTGTTPVEIVQVEITGEPEGTFIGIGPPSIRLEPNRSISYGITFTPAEVRSYAGTLTFKLADGSLLPIRLLAAGVAQERYRFWVDSALADVNQRFDLHLRTSPDLRIGEGVTSYSITLRYSPTALYLHRSTAPDGTENTITYIGEDTAVISHSGTAPLSGPVLASFSFEGLVTGRPANTVELIEVALGGDTSRGSIRGNGLVELRGCDIGFGVGFGRPVVARGAWPAPAADRVTLRYIAPEGSLPALSVIDLTGREQSGGSLPAGTGSEQEATVDLRALDPGFYVLELRSGSGRSSIPIVISR